MEWVSRYQYSTGRPADRGGVGLIVYGGSGEIVIIISYTIYIFYFIWVYKFIIPPYPDIMSRSIYIRDPSARIGIGRPISYRFTDYRSFFLNIGISVG